MKSPDLSRNSFYDSPMFASSPRTAHSGPELLSFVPQSHLAHDLAQTLLTDCMNVTQSFGSSSSSSSFSCASQIGLCRR